MVAIAIALAVAVDIAIDMAVAVTIVKLGSHGGLDFTEVMAISKGMEQRRS